MYSILQRSCYNNWNAFLSFRGKINFSFMSKLHDKSFSGSFPIKPWHMNWWWFSYTYLCISDLPWSVVGDIRIFHRFLFDASLSFFKLLNTQSRLFDCFPHYLVFDLIPWHGKGAEISNSDKNSKTLHFYWFSSYQNPNSRFPKIYWKNNKKWFIKFMSIIAFWY